MGDAIIDDREEAMIETYQFDPHISYGFLTRYRAALSICHGALGYVDAFKMAWSTRNKTAAEARKFFTQEWQNNYEGSGFSFWDSKFHANDVAFKLLSSCTNLDEQGVESNIANIHFQEILPYSYRRLRHIFFERISCQEDQHLFSVENSPPSEDEIHRIIGCEGLDYKTGDEASFNELLKTRPVKKLLDDRVQLITILGGKRIFPG
ncbi:MAG: hypothetical protein K0S07_1428 [Chlamydiales bacterium]|jgi:hypothetical protein|nr:hypothetical protein [Chlamydiales bacterium]